MKEFRSYWKKNKRWIGISSVSYTHLISIGTDYDYVFRTGLCGSDVILCLPDARAYTGGIDVYKRQLWTLLCGEILSVWKVIPLMAGSLLLSAFFCLFHLFMYYITQPYTEEKTVKSPIFSVVNALVYFCLLYTSRCV